MATVLVVDDAELDRRIAGDCIKEVGSHAVFAENGREAIERIEAENFDLVLMDIQMPEMDGLTATRYVRSQKRFDDVPIVAMTAQAIKGDREECLSMGMNDYITSAAPKSKFVKVPSLLF